MPAYDAVVLDVDGTLVDTNYQHALAWYRAFRRVGITLPVWRLHRAIGMGGDQLVAAVAGDDAEREHGDTLRVAWAEEFQPMLGEVAAFDRVRELLRAIGEHGPTVVLASSGKPEHVDAYLDLFDGRDLAAAWTTSEDVERTKPEPDLVAAALDRAGGGDALVVGDTVWDMEAAGRAGQACVAVRTGGFSAAELRDAGALAVYDSVGDLCEDLDAVLAGSPSVVTSPSGSPVASVSG
ncbi:MAG: HAD family hydrolase [Pseudonocardia sp. SCN 72-86]|nr:MAG: HAD family hydrolase [Pseudonocardia sp. SCN 72-86]